MTISDYSLPVVSTGHDTRICRKCKSEKDLADFVKNAACLKGRARICKKCAGEYIKKHKANYSQHVKDKQALNRKINA